MDRDVCDRLRDEIKQLKEKIRIIQPLAIHKDLSLKQIRERLETAIAIQKRQTKLYYAEHKEQIREYQRKYYQLAKERKKEYFRNYYQKFKTRLLARARVNQEERTAKLLERRLKDLQEKYQLDLAKLKQEDANNGLAIRSSGSSNS